MTLNGDDGCGATMNTPQLPCRRAVGAGALFCDRLLFGHAVAARTEAEPLLWGHKEVDGRSNVNNIQ